MESVITEEKIPSDTDISFTKEKLNEATSNQAEEQTDTMLDEVAARVDALDFNNVGDVKEPEDPKATVHKQGEIIKKQAETINTLISQLRIMFDEYNDAINEKGYYEDLSEALLRYIEICEGKIQLDQDESETGNSTPRNQDEKEEILDKKEEILDKQDSTALSTETDAPSFSTQSSEQIEGAGATAASTDENNNEKEEEATGDSKEKEEEEEKVTISNSELIRLNHILLREIIELRNERDVLRSNIHEYLLSEDDDESPTDEDEDTATDEETHRCEHCTTGNKKSEEDKEEYENRDEQPEMMENKDEHLE